MLPNVEAARKLLKKLHKDLFHEDSFNTIVSSLTQRQQNGLVIEDGVDIFIVCSVYHKNVISFSLGFEEDIDFILRLKSTSSFDIHKDSTMLCIELYSHLYPHYNEYAAYILKEAIKYCIPF